MIRLVDHRLTEDDAFLGASRDVCTHWRTRVRITEDRTVICKVCEAVLNPVDVLLEMAKSWDRCSHNLKLMRQESLRVRRELDDVKRQVRNAKAQLRRAEGKLFDA